MIPSKQIGWSQESNLLWEISNQLDKTLGFMCTGPCPPPPPTTTTTTTINTNMSLRVPYDAGTDNFNIPGYVDGSSEGDFTIEWFARMQSDDNHPRAWSIGNFYDGASSAVSIENGTFYYWINGTIIISFNLTGIDYLLEWTHFCIQRKNDTITVFVDGVDKGSETILSDIPTRGFPLYIASEGVDSLQNGLVSNFRWVVGEHVYTTSPFTPPTTNLVAVSGTKLLIFQGTDLPEVLTDNSGLNNTIENGTGTFNIYWPASCEGSILFGIAP